MPTYLLSLHDVLVCINLCVKTALSANIAAPTQGPQGPMLQRGRVGSRRCSRASLGDEEMWQLLPRLC